MAQIKNLEGLNTDQINRELRNGARFVVFHYCVSFVVMTIRPSSDIYFVRQGESTTRFSIGFTLLSLVVGWWGIPWGPIHTISSLYHNFRGGRDVTQEVLAAINGQENAS